MGVDQAKLDIINITFSGGLSQFGGGVYIENSTPKLSGIIIEKNSAEVGGGVYLNQSNLELVNINVYDNGANFGGGIYATGSVVKLIDVSIDSNLAYWGAGIYSEDSNFDIENSELILNHAYVEGGAIYQSGNSIRLSGTAVTGNIGLDFGGALVCYNGLLDIQNSTVAGNDANYGSALNLREAALTMKNSILWENGENSVYVSSGNQSSMISIEYSNLYGGEEYLNSASNTIINWGVGNMNSDPLFCNPGQNDFGLQENSICLTASDSTGFIGAYEESCSQQLSSKGKSLPLSFDLFQNYPNPFNPETIIRFNSNEIENVNISIYSLNGLFIKELLSMRLNPGSHSVKWNGLDKGNVRVSSGVYLCRMVSGEKVSSLKMILAK